MTTQRNRGGSPSDPMQAGAQIWESGYESLLEGQRQAQEFWNSMARTWGETAGAWMGQLGQSDSGMMGESAAVLRELQEAAFSAAMAWMRLPLTLVGGAPPDELQETVTRLTEAQGRAYQLWMDALGRAGDAVGDSAEAAARGTAGAARQSDGRKRR